MKNLFRKKNSLYFFFLFNSLGFIFFYIFFLIFPNIDIQVSNIFFFKEKFISEEYIFIKSLRVFLKNFMIIIPLFSLIILLFNFVNFKKKKKDIFSLRIKYACLGLIIGPIIGSGIIANWYFKDHWGRARPVHIVEFGGDKTFTSAFTKSDQCKKNCSWISGETSAAFSFFVGTILFKNPIFFFFNLLLGVLVFFCRLSMGGHFLSDNIFAVIFMFYLAIAYRYLIYFLVKKNNV